MTGAAQPCVLEIGDDLFSDMEIKDFGFWGAGVGDGAPLDASNDTGAGILCSGFNWSKFDLWGVYCRNVAYGVDMDNTSVLPENTTIGANGELFRCGNGHLAGRDGAYFNRSRSGQAYPHVITDSEIGTTRNGASIIHVANVLQPSGIQLSVRDCSATAVEGALPNAIVEAHGAFDMVNVTGGRYEHYQTLLKITSSIGHGFINNATFAGFTATGVGGNYSSGAVQGRGPLVSTVAGGQSDTLVTVQGVNLQSGYNALTAPDVPARRSRG